jgi:hypothetical protein
MYFGVGSKDSEEPSISADVRSFEQTSPHGSGMVVCHFNTTSMHCGSMEIVPGTLDGMAAEQEELPMPVTDLIRERPRHAFIGAISAS